VAEDTVEKWSRVLLLCMFAVRGSGQTQPPICPKHIESPTYPPLARQTRLMGEVILSVTVDAEGKVQGVMTLPGSANRQAPKLLRDSAVENMQHWTFSKPPAAPYTEVIVYDYEDDPSLPPSGGPKGLPVLTKVVFDLPDHVRISMNEPIIESGESKERP
jgi:TonB family protein